MRSARTRKSWLGFYKSWESISVFKFEHTQGGLTKLLHVAQELESSCGIRSARYQSAYSNRLRKFHLRKVKTDTEDAYFLGEMYYTEEFESFKKRGVQLLNLRYLTR